jgi:hypothetical protein
MVGARRVDASVARFADEVDGFVGKDDCSEASSLQQAY